MKSHLRRLLPGENTRLLAVAAFIGLMSGILNIVFRTTVHLVDEYIFNGGKELLQIDLGGYHLLLLPLIPMFGMVLLIPLTLLFPGEVNGYGFTKFLRKVNLEGGYLRIRTIYIKILSTAITIGTGNSAGVEGPIAQIGGAMGSQVGQFFRVSGNRMKLYIAAGCAGGIAGMFNAPIAGIFFAAEIVLLGTYEISSFSALITASAISTVVTRSYFGEASLFTIPQYDVVNHFVELPLYCLLAALTGLLAVFHIKVFYWVRDFYQNLKIPFLLKPITGAFIVGSIGIMFPQVMGDGYHFIETVLYGGAMSNYLFCLIFLKVLATAITLGSGGAGGVFAPALFIGTMIGGSFGGFVHNLFPDSTAGPGAYASVGIGAFLAASTHAPLTAIFLLFEMTGNYEIIVPAMLASIIGTMAATWLNEDSIDTVDFSREGINIHEGREVAIMKSLRVGLAITEDVDVISEEANINQLLMTFSETKSGFYFPVIGDTGKMTGIISMTDVKNIIHRDSSERSAQTVGSICQTDIIMLTPDDTLYKAMQLFDIKGIQEIPVVESMDNRWVLGMLKRRSVISAYNREVLKKGISEKVGSIRVSHPA
ncbi:chloride channel protein [Desulforhopalus sp. 52FAK]